MRDSMIIYRSFYEAIKELPDENKLNVLMAVLEYGIDGEEPELSGIDSALFLLMRPQIEANQKRYDNGKKGADYGTRGGRPKNDETPKETPNTENENPKQTPKKPQANPKETPNTENENPKQTPNVNDNVNVIEKESEKEKDAAASSLPLPAKEKYKKHGEYGWVKLNDEQYTRLISEYGESIVSATIRYIDESAQRTANKNHWRDWNLVVRKAIRENWGNIKSAASSSANRSYDIDEIERMVTQQYRDSR